MPGTKVKILGRKGSRYTVEYGEGLSKKRVYLPVQTVREIDGEYYSAIEPNLGIPYGLPWADIARELKFSPERLEEELHKEGIWEYSDLVANPQGVSSALRATLGYGSMTLRALTQKFLNSEESES